MATVRESTQNRIRQYPSIKPSSSFPRFEHPPSCLLFLFVNICFSAGVLLELRFNRGWADETALKLLSYFNDSNKVVFTKKAKMGEQFTKPQKIILNSQSNSYNKKVVLLTSSETCSAAEIFVLASLRLPNIIRIGNSTSGHFSDAIPKAIPSGWTFRMSMEVYLDQQKKNYEVIGIPPDIKTESTSKALFENLLENKTDAAMIKAIEILRK